MKQFFSGSTIKLDFKITDYPATEWAATLFLKSLATTKSFPAVAAGSGFEVLISAADSEGIEAGTYTASYKITKGEEVAFVESSYEILFKPNPTQSGDGRSQWVKDLAAVDEAIRKKVSGGAVESYSITTTVGTRNLTNMALADLRQHRRWVLGKVDAERVKMGKRPISKDRHRRIKSHLGNQSVTSRRRYN